METAFFVRTWRRLPWLAALALALGAQAALAQEEADPPARVGVVTQREGGVVFAPEGEDEWVDLPANRPLTRGDRLWSDRGARAELHLGTATLHLDGESHLGVSVLDERAAQFILMQGAVNARVRELAAGENFEIDTPNLALRAAQAGDYRVDVSEDGSQTRVVVHSGVAAVFGEGGQSLHLGAGQQASFAGRSLAQVQAPQWRSDSFGQWAAERNRAEDQSIAARHLPRGVVGYPQLDRHGSWSQDPEHGTVWYPQVAVADWAPYRYGRWDWVDPWGWTWVDDAPWGFAPFHYGRWAMIGSRWAWVPGRLAPRPVYAPALVAFVGGDGFNVSIASGPGVGWYPLAPGEAWWPAYRASPRYVGFVNFNINLGRQPRHADNHVHRRFGHGVTAARQDDFRDRRARRQPQLAAPRLQAAPRAGVQPNVPSRDWGVVREQRIDRNDARRAQSVRPVEPRLHQPPAQPREWRRDDDAVREQWQAQREQQRLQREAERDARRQQREAWQQRQQGVAPPPRGSFPQQPMMQPPPRQEAAPIGRQRDGRGDRGDRGQRDDDGRRGGWNR